MNNYQRPISNLSDESALAITSSLNNLLANEYALFTKTLNFHWNITGPRFHSIHEFLEDHYKILLSVMDDVAERVRILGEVPHGSVKKMGEQMDIKESDGMNMSGNEMISDLLTDHVKIQSFIKETISHEDLFKNDPGTEDYLVGLLQKHEKMSWMLKSHLD